MSQRGELSTDCEYASPVVRGLFPDRTPPFEAAIATIANTASPEASAFLRAGAPATPGIEAGWLSVLVASAAPDGSSDPEPLDAGAVREQIKPNP